MAQSRTRFRGLDVHKETMAVASVAQEPGARRGSHRGLWPQGGRGSHAGPDVGP